jgi:hypothetical protein
MFWGFVFRLLVGAVLAPIAFAFMLMPFIGLMALTARGGRSKLSPVAYPVLALALLAQLYFWGMWAAYCAALALVRASHEVVTHTWLYYIVGFLFVTAPIGYLASKEQASAASAAEGGGIQRGSTLYSAFAILAFLAFVVWPPLMTTPYGWFVGLTVPIEGRAARGVEDEYFRTLNSWADRGGPIDEVQETVVATCGKLVMLNATPADRVRLSTTDRDEFHFRVDVCTKITVNRVHAQPELQKKELVSAICDQRNVEIFTKLCARSGLH